MLNVLRDSFKTTPYLKIILGLVAVSLVLFLGSFFVGDQSSGARGNWVARVNDAPIPEWRFREMARQIDQNYRELFGQNYEQIKPQLQIRRRALETLVDKELILQDARRIGLRGSSADLAEQIRNHPSLQDASGQFIGTERYKRMLERNYPGGYTAFERTLAEDLLERQWSTLVTQPVTVHDNELREIFRGRTVKTAIDYVFVAGAEQTIEREITDDELRRWYDANAETYMREAGQQIRYVVIDRDSLLADIEVSADEIGSYYATNQSNYSHPEQRRARHILLRLDPGSTDEEQAAVRDNADVVLQRLRDGEDFTVLAQELSDDTISAERGGDLDFFARGQMVEAFDQATFDTPVGEFAPITETPFGVHVIQVTDSRPAGVRPLSELADDIRRLLQFRQVDELVATEAQRLRDEMGGADRLDAVATQAGLTVASGFLSAGEVIPDLGPTAPILDSVAGLEVGALSHPLRIPRGMALVVVDDALPAAPAPFDEVKDDVTAAVLQDLKLQAATDRARRSYERQADLDAVARDLGLEKKSSDDLAPGQAPPDTGSSTAELETALFGDDAEDGKRGVVTITDGAIVYEIERREPFDPARFESEKHDLRRETLDNRRTQFRQSLINRLREQQQVEYNPAWLERLDET